MYTYTSHCSHATPHGDIRDLFHNPNSETSSTRTFIASVEHVSYFSQSMNMLQAHSQDCFENICLDAMYPNDTWKACAWCNEIFVIQKGGEEITLISNGLTQFRCTLPSSNRTMTKCNPGKHMVLDWWLSTTSQNDRDKRKDEERKNSTHKYYTIPIQPCDIWRNISISGVHRY